MTFAWSWSDAWHGVPAATITSPLEQSISSSRTTVTAWWTSISSTLSNPWTSSLIRDSRPLGWTSTRSPIREVPEQTVPEKPLKPELGRLTHWTGSRKGSTELTSSISTASRISSREFPSYQGVVSEPTITLSPWSADMGTHSTSLKSKPRENSS